MVTFQDLFLFCSLIVSIITLIVYLINHQNKKK